MTSTYVSCATGSQFLRSRRITRRRFVFIRKQSYRPRLLLYSTDHGNGPPQAPPSSRHACERRPSTVRGSACSESRQEARAIIRTQRNAKRDTQRASRSSPPPARQRQRTKRTINTNMPHGHSSVRRICSNGIGVKLLMSTPRERSSASRCGGTSLWIRSGRTESSAFGDSLVCNQRQIRITYPLA